jgi:hypothetical protein
MSAVCAGTGSLLGRLLSVGRTAAIGVRVCLTALTFQGGFNGPRSGW